MYRRSGDVSVQTQWGRRCIDASLLYVSGEGQGQGPQVQHQGQPFVSQPQVQHQGQPFGSQPPVLEEEQQEVKSACRTFFLEQIPIGEQCIHACITSHSPGFLALLRPRL